MTKMKTMNELIAQVQRSELTAREAAAQAHPYALEYFMATNPADFVTMQEIRAAATTPATDTVAADAKLTITVTRSDPLANVCTDSYEPGVLSVEKFNSWADVFAYLRGRKIPLTAEHEAAFIEHEVDGTNFGWNEFVNAGHSAYTAKIHYDIVAVRT